jgi:hypothetical protein
LTYFLWYNLVEAKIEYCKMFMTQIDLNEGFFPFLGIGFKCFFGKRGGLFLEKQN